MINEETIAIADAVVAHLHKNGFEEASRRLFVNFKLKDFSSRKITVSPIAYELEHLNRGQMTMTSTIQIGYQQLLTEKNPEHEIEEKLQLMRGMAKLFIRLVNLSKHQATVCGIDNTPLFDHASARESNLFVSVLTLTTVCVITAEAQYAEV